MTNWPEITIYRLSQTVVSENNLSNSNADYVLWLQILLPTIPFPSTGESQKEKIHSILTKTKVLYQGSWRQVFEQTYNQQTGSLENLFSIQNLKISFIGFVIVPVMCISIWLPVCCFVRQSVGCNFWHFSKCDCLYGGITFAILFHDKSCKIKQQNIENIQESNIDC